MHDSEVYGTEICSRKYVIWDTARVNVLVVSPHSGRSTSGPAISRLSLWWGVLREALFSLLFRPRSLSICGSVMDAPTSGLSVFFTVLMNLLGSEPQHLLLWGGPAIYQTEAVSTGSPKGKKHGSLYRLTPPCCPPYSCSLSLCLPVLPPARCFYSPDLSSCYSELCLSEGNNPAGVQGWDVGGRRRGEKREDIL